MEENTFQVWEVWFEFVSIIDRVIIIYFVSISPFDHWLPADPLKDLLGSDFFVTIIDQQKGEAFEFFVDPWIPFVILFEC